MGIDGDEVLGGDRAIDPAVPDPQYGGTGPNGAPWTYRTLVRRFGGVLETYDAALAGAIHVDLVVDCLDPHILAMHWMTRVIERAITDQVMIPPAVMQDMILPKPTPRRPGPNDQPMPIPKKCIECQGAPSKHSPNCPLGKAWPERVTWPT